MAKNSVITKTGDGVTTQWVVNFTGGFLEEAHVTCQVNGEVDGAGDPVYRDITFINPGLIEVGGAAAPVDAPLLFERTTPIATAVNSFGGGNAFSAAAVDTSFLQVLFGVQEAQDQLEGTKDLDAAILAVDIAETAAAASAASAEADALDAAAVLAAIDPTQFATKAANLGDLADAEAALTNLGIQPATQAVLTNDALVIIGDAGVDNATIQQGTYSYLAGSGSTGGPAGETFGVLIHRRRATGTGDIQIFVSQSTGDIYTRCRLGTGWKPWVGRRSTQAEAEAGTDEVTYMTPLRTKQAVTALDKTTRTGSFGLSPSSALDFASLPAAIQKIRVKFVQASADINSNLLVQLGTSGGMMTSGYASASFDSGGTSTSNNGFAIQMNATSLISGVLLLERLTPGSDTWISSHSLGKGTTAGNDAVAGGGRVFLGDELTSVRIALANGSAVFDGGSVALEYET